MPRRLPVYRQSLVLKESAQQAESVQARWNALPVLSNKSLSSFKTQAFDPAKPFLFPRGTFASIPAIKNWFIRDDDHEYLTVNQLYLKHYGDAMLPVEYTASKGGQETFQRGSFPLAFLLPWISHATSSSSVAQRLDMKLYVAQAPLSLLPVPLHNDLPAPEYVQKGGKGDIYDSSLWLGVAPTYTPLHKDPNPNLFVHLAGRKTVRILSPEEGNLIMERIRERTGKQGHGSGMGANAFRGEEMMVGREREELDAEIWGDRSGSSAAEGWEAELGSGDGIFIPTGFWHSIKGIGNGVNASANWWFR